MHDDLTTPVLLGVAVVGAALLLPLAGAAGIAAGRFSTSAARRAGRWLGLVLEAGAGRVARRAAAGLLGSVSALLALTAPARAAVPPDRSAAATANDPARTRPPGATRAVVVVVRAGDTLWDIARRHLPPGAGHAEVARAWPLWYAANRSVIGPDPDLLMPGQRLRAPGGTGLHRRPTGTSSPQHHPSPATDVVASAASLDPDRR